MQKQCSNNAAGLQRNNDGVRVADGGPGVSGGRWRCRAIREGVVDDGERAGGVVELISLPSRRNAIAEYRHGSPQGRPKPAPSRAESPQGPELTC